MTHQELKKEVEMLENISFQEKMKLAQKLYPSDEFDQAMLKTNQYIDTKVKDINIQLN